MFSRRTRKRIEELEKNLHFYKEKTARLNKELCEVKSERNSLSKLFSSIFHRHTLGDIEKLVVDKTDDANSILKLWTFDEHTFEYEIKLVKYGYEETFSIKVKNKEDNKNDN